MKDKIPQFKDLKFKTLREFDAWLKKTTCTHIVLRDLGQDMQHVWAHRSGEILNCDFNAGMYNGKFINMKKLKQGDFLEIWDHDIGYMAFKGLIIEESIAYL